MSRITAQGRGGAFGRWIGWGTKPCAHFLAGPIVAVVCSIVYQQVRLHYASDAEVESLRETYQMGWRIMGPWLVMIPFSYLCHRFFVALEE